MNLALDAATTEDAEHYLNLKGWGTWLRAPGTDRRPLGYKQQLWQRLYDAGWKEGWQAPKRNYDEHPIDEDYAQLLDRMIAALPEQRKDLLVMVYAYQVPVLSVAKAMRMSRVAVRQERDAAIWALYGALKK